MPRPRSTFFFSRSYLCPQVERDFITSCRYTGIRIPEEQEWRQLSVTKIKKWRLQRANSNVKMHSLRKRYPFSHLGFLSIFFFSLSFSFVLLVQESTTKSSSEEISRELVRARGKLRIATGEFMRCRAILINRRRRLYDAGRSNSMGY